MCDKPQQTECSISDQKPPYSHTTLSTPLCQILEAKFGALYCLNGRLFETTRCCKLGVAVAHWVDQLEGW